MVQRGRNLQYIFARVFPVGQTMSAQLTRDINRGCKIGCTNEVAGNFNGVSLVTDLQKNDTYVKSQAVQMMSLPDGRNPPG